MNKKQKGFDEFIALCLRCSETNLLPPLFDLFLTEEEKEDIALRYLIIKELVRQEKSQREIAKSLNVSIAKITRGSHELKRIHKKLLAQLKDK